MEHFLIESGTQLPPTEQLIRHTTSSITTMQKTYLSSLEVSEVLAMLELNVEVRGDEECSGLVGNEG